MRRRCTPIAIVLDFGHMGGSWELESAGSIGDLTRFVLDHQFIEQGYFILAQDYSYFHIIDRFTIHQMSNIRLIDVAPRLGVLLDKAKQMLLEGRYSTAATLICHKALLAPALRVGKRCGLTLAPPKDTLPSSFHPGCHCWAHRSASHWQLYRYFCSDENLYL